MKVFQKESLNYKMFKEAKYLSKNDIIKKFNKIKGTINKLTKDVNKNENRNKFNKMNDMGKKNLTCLNFYDSSYKMNNFSENKIKFSTKKLKQDLLFDYTEYSSFISKNSKLLNSEFPITGLYTPRKTLNEMKLKRFLSARTYNIDNSEDRTKSSTSKNTKTNRKSNKLMLSPYSAKVNINFNPNYNRQSLNNLLKTSFSKYRREDILSFMEKTRMIRREKYIKLKLQNKMQYEREMNKEKINIINTNKQEYFNNLSLLNKFDKTFNDYIKKLELEKIKETQVNAQLCKRKVELEISIQKMQKEINKLKIKIKRYQNFKEFLLLVKYGSDALKDNKEKSKEKEKEKSKEKEKEKEKEKSKEKLKEKEMILSLTENSDINEKRKDLSVKPNKNRHRKSVCIDMENFIKNKKTNFPYFSVNMRKKSSRSTKKERTSITKVNTIIGKKSSSTLIQELNNSPIFKNEDEFESIFIRIENIIINDLDYLTSQKKIINQLKSNLEKAQNESKNNNYILIESKERKLEYEKKENEKLNNKLELIIQNNSMKKSLKNNLEKKIGKMLSNIFEKIGDKKKFDMKELAYILKMDNKEFFNKKLYSKILYMIKMIELAASYLIDSINKYKDNPKLQDIFRVIEREKNKELHFLKMEQLRKNLEDKKANIMKRSNKIYFLSKIKYDAKNSKKNNKKLIKKKVIKRNKSNDSIQQWLSYN